MACPNKSSHEKSFEIALLLHTDFLSFRTKPSDLGSGVPALLGHAHLDDFDILHVLRDLVDGGLKSCQCLLVGSLCVLDGAFVCYGFVVFVWVLMFLGSHIAIDDQ